MRTISQFINGQSVTRTGAVTSPVYDPSTGQDLLQEIPKLRIGVATDPDAQMGPVVTAEHKEKIEGYIQLAIDEGAKLVIDGRGRSLPGHEEGFFLWPTLID
jgi:malonate-semialdehyde dehydrogenase (acetylating)/methylmalonate-semialdehyde dehydrogenase